MTNCSTIRRLGRPRKAESEKRVYVGVSLPKELVANIDKFVGEKFQYNRSAAFEDLLICGLREQKGRK